ncbi:hypothetical protein E5163_10195 [Marinicauda algicola]|uniref:Uncharacterized protein n=1 Tax=Marinicauda algicola TaxID=2029849 RepID=A0A4S2GYL8_9PROT|nr:hypothetical protein [Marinicauda algicola]TGY88194.1 hypothetical protein E5163_10195 [Marinicauda algicola]
MSIPSQVQRFESLGLSARNILHIGVHVLPATEVKDGQFVETHKIYVGEGSGNFGVDFPTDLIFASMSEDWAFENFDLAGKNWPGLAIFPDDGDFTVEFGDSGQNSVLLKDACKAFCAHRYQIVMRHKTTGQLIATDPTIDNRDRQAGPS